MKATSLLNPKCFLIVAFALSGFAYEVQAQKQGKQALMDSVKAKVEAKTYFFKANSANSKRGRNIDLTVDNYGINVTPISVKCDLPFYGESYGGTGGYGGSGSGPIKFESTEFFYEAVPRKKGGWTVTIRPKAAAGVQEVILSISEEGYTNVTVTSTNRSVMNYYGNLQ
jgi:hypothetical protein